MKNLILLVVLICFNGCVVITEHRPSSNYYNYPRYSEPVVVYRHTPPPPPIIIYEAPKPKKHYKPYYWR